MKRSYKNGDNLTQAEEDFIYKKEKCPDCKGKLLRGPEGGMSLNCKCSKCGAEFNIMGMLGIHRISDNFKYKNNNDSI